MLVAHAVVRVTTARQLALDHLRLRSNRFIGAESSRVSAIRYPDSCASLNWGISTIRRMCAGARVGASELALGSPLALSQMPSMIAFSVLLGRIAARALSSSGKK